MVSPFHNVHTYADETAITIYVGTEKNDFKTINEALNYARYFASFNTKVNIHIREGEYDETIFLFDNPGISLIGDGVGKTVIKSKTRYPNATICATGDSYVEGITFISTDGAYAYTLHYEIGNGNVQGNTIFKDCEFISNGELAAIGAGLGENCTLELDNCKITNSKGMGLYFHNSPIYQKNNQNIVMNNCTIETLEDECAIVIDDSAALYGTDNSFVNIKINGLVTSSKKMMFRNEQGEYDRIPADTNNFNISEGSCDNDIECLNFSKIIKDTCQMPYSEGGYLIGVETYDNPDNSYKYEILILDCLAA